MSDSPVFSSPAGSPKPESETANDDDYDKHSYSLEKRPVRILCLHGYASNSKILKKQIAPIIERLPKSYEWHYLDGLAPCGESDEETGPKLCYYHTPNIHQISQGIRYIWNNFLYNGHFDVILGFGQGAALAASFLLHHHLESPGLSQFKSAIFICPTSPFAKCLQLGYNARQMFGIKEKIWDLTLGRPVDIPKELLHTEEQKTCPEYEMAFREEIANLKPEGIENFAWNRDAYEMPACTEEGHEKCAEWRKNEEEEMINPEDKTFYQMFHCIPDRGLKVQIPTVHVHGYEDPWRKHGNEMLGLFNRDSFHVTLLDGGHEIVAEEADEIVEDIKEAFKEAGIPFEEEEEEEE
ncbi:hypothetical protein QBC38DRAFT_458780 [Podospora fimiseda]|uniref:Serine hydrolase domain-containing protein n=1 Tax=Podospora fimiseda TaxID=252190 RepID=A0AAN7GPV2_9PEZI|nr:hypothetical protein QBC38DRAFT_458780 [Podospora fimiseda]